MAMVTSLSWMVNVRMSFVIVRIPVRIRNDQHHVPLGRTTCCLLLHFKDRSGMLFANVCAGFFFFVVRSWWRKVVFGFFGFPLVPCASWGTSFAGYPPCVYKVWVSNMCLMLDTPCGRRSVGTPGESAGQHKKTSNQMCFGFCGFHRLKLYIFALVGRSSLQSYNACKVYWIQGASPRDCRQKHGKTSFSP